MAPHLPDINSRQRNIIRVLLSTQGKVTLNELARKTNLTSRVVRYNIDVAASWLNHYEVKLIDRRGYGIEIVASQQKRTEVLEDVNQLDDGNIVLSREQRIRIIILYLLTSKEPITTETISEVESFSRSIIFKDINEIETWLEMYRISLIRRTSKGMWINCSEELRRFALVRLIKEELGNKDWLTLYDTFPSRNAKYNNEFISACFNQFLNKLDLSFTHDLVQSIEENLGFPMSNVSQTEIMLYLAIAIHAIVDGKTIAGDLDQEVSKYDENTITQAIAYKIQNSYNCELSDKEKEIITSLIKSCKLEPPDNPKTQSGVTTYISSQDSERLAQELVDACSMRLHPIIKIDEMLVNELANHLDYAIFRLKHHIPIRNPHLGTMRKKYRLIYSVVDNNVALLEKQIHESIPAEEIGYISMYFLSALERLYAKEDFGLKAIIANDGVRSKSSLLKSRLQVEFPNLRVTRVVNNFHGLTTNDIDGEIIISTIPIVDAPLPVIEVSPFLEFEDINKIQRWISEKNQSRQSRGFTGFVQDKTLLDLIKLPHIVFMPTVNHWNEIVNTACEPLLASKCIQPSYLQAMTNLIGTHGFYMNLGEGVLLLHAKPTDGVNQLCMSFLKLVRPYHLDNSGNPDIDIVFVLGAVDDNTHLTALFQLNELIRYPEFLKAIRESKNPQDIIQILWQWVPKLPKAV
jgi:transcriptional antiterminator/mannitol/fructose-specific phosphotransferase system IIA component (Ntr-type)